jgi:hypothetical protein
MSLAERIVFILAILNLIFLGLELLYNISNALVAYL